VVLVLLFLSIPTARYSGTTTGSPTVTTSGANTILTFTTVQAHTRHKEKQMSHFAKVENGIVVQVIVAEQDVID
jgi:hypothetical protein